MCREQYDITYGDLNPSFLFSCTMKRSEDEKNYHSHDFIELVVILKGEGLFYINGREYQVQEGDLLILNPGTYHKSLRRPGAVQAATECYVSFTNVDFKGCARDHMPLLREEIVMAMPDGLKQEIFRICGAIAKEYQTQKTARYFMLKAYLIQLICLIEREKTEQESGSHNQGYTFKSVNKKYVVQQIMKYMEEHYREKISLDQIADNMYLSPFYISKIFKTETGDTPINYLIGLRMEKAREILDADKNVSIQAAAAAVGYEDAYHFSKLFKKYFGISPLFYKTKEE